MITVLEVSVDRDLILYPAIESVGEVYFLRDDKIIGEGGANVAYDSEVGAQITTNVEEILGEDLIKVWRNGAPDLPLSWIYLRFTKYTGEFLQTNPHDLPNNHLMDLKIVSKRDFDYGLGSKKRYGHIEGYGKVYKNYVETNN